MYSVIITITLLIALFALAVWYFLHYSQLTEHKVFQNIWSGVYGPDKKPIFLIFGKGWDKKVKCITVSDLARPGTVETFDILEMSDTRLQFKSDSPGNPVYDFNKKGDAWIWGPIDTGILYRVYLPQEYPVKLGLFPSLGEVSIDKTGSDFKVTMGTFVSTTAT